MVNITDAFVQYLFSKADEITDSVREKAECCKSDYNAVTIAGAAKNRIRWAKVLENSHGGNARVTGYAEKTDSKTAALINGFNAHALELDDGQRFAMIHLGASVISAIQAASDDYEISAERFLTGIIMGYEAACRAAIAMQPSHKSRGYHTAGTCGTIGSAAGVAFALGFDKEQMKRALTCAAGSAAGMLEIQEQKSEVKPYNLGRAAMDGLAAAYMGLTDFETPDDMLGGERGFFTVFSDEYSGEKLTEKQPYFEIERIYTKPYASCRHSHAAVEAAIKLGKETDTGLIEKVTVATYKLGVKGHDHTDISGVASAKLSTPYAVAAGLLRGRADLTVFEPLDEEVILLAKKIEVTEDPALTAQCPEKRAAAVTVLLKDGTSLFAQVDYAKGEPENPMNKEDFDEKKRMLLEYAANLNG